jgi:hypothetical protein
MQACRSHPGAGKAERRAYVDGAGFKRGQKPTEGESVPHDAKRQLLLLGIVGRQREVRRVVSTGAKRTRVGSD